MRQDDRHPLHWHRFARGRANGRPALGLDEYRHTWTGDRYVWTDRGWAAMVTPLRVAPLDDAELLGAVATALRQVVLPELERAGAEEFVLSQVRSCLSIVRFVSSG